MRFCAKKLRKTKILFHAQLSQKIFPVLCKLRKKNNAKPRKAHCVSCAKIAQKFAKKNLTKIAQILRKRFSHFVETLVKRLKTDYLQLWFLYKSNLRISTAGKRQELSGIKSFQTRKKKPYKNHLCIEGSLKLRFQSID